MLNCWPITLLNVDYKLISQVLGNRISQIMPELINETQFAVKGRGITNGLILVRDTLSYLKDHDHDAYHISIEL